MTINEIDEQFGRSTLVFARLSDLRLLFEEIAQKQIREHQELTKTKDELLTVTEVMSILKVSRTALFRWQKSGYLVPIKTGGRCRYRQSDIDAIQRK